MVANGGEWSVFEVYLSVLCEEREHAVFNLNSDHLYIERGQEVPGECPFLTSQVCGHYTQIRATTAYI
jgi:hypothetical protein